MERPRITLEVTFRDDIDGEEVSLKGYFTFEVENHIITVRAASLPNNAVISAALTQDDGIITERGFKICSNVEGNEDVTKCLLCPCLLPTAMNQNDLPDWKQQGTRSDQCICCMHNDLAKQSQNKDAISTCHCDPAKRDGPELPTKIERLIQVTYELESELEETSKVPGPSEEQILEETPKMKCLCKEGAHADAAKKLPEQVVQSPTPNYEKDKPEQQIISPRPAMQEVRTPGQTPQKPSQYPPQGSPSPPKSAITTSPNQTKSKRTKDKPEQKIISPQPAKQEVRTPVQTPQKTSPCPPLGRPIPPKSASTTSPNQTKSMRTKDKPEQKIISPQPAKQEVRTPVQTPQKTSPCPPLGRPIPPKSASTTSPNQTKSMRTKDKPEQKIISPQPAKQEVRTPVQTPQKTSPCPPLGRPIPPKSASTTSPNQTKSMRTKDKPEQKIISPQPAKQEVRTPVQTPQKTSPCPPLGRPSPPKSAFTTSPNQTKSMRTKDKPEQKIISPQPAKQEVRTPVQTPQKPSSYPPQGSPSTSESAFIASPNRTESKQTPAMQEVRTPVQTPQKPSQYPPQGSPSTPESAFIASPNRTESKQTITRSDNLTDYRRLDGTLSTTTEDEQSFQYPQTRPGTPQFSSPETPQAGDRAFIGSPHQTGVSQPSPPDTDWASRKQPTKKVTFADETQYKEPPEELKEHHLGPIDTKLTRPEETFQDGEPFTSPRQFAHPTDKKRLAGPSGVDSPQPETAERGTPPKTAYQPPEYFDPNSSIVYSDPIASSTPLRLSLEDGVKLEQIPQPSKQVVQPETVGPVVQSAPVEQVEDLVLYDLIKEVYDLHKLSQNSDLEESKQGSFHEENEVGPLKALRAIHNQRMDELHKHAEKIYNKKYNQEELDTFRKVFDEHKSESREGVNFWDDSNFYVEVNRSLRELPNEKRASFTPGQNTSSAGFPSDLKKSRRKSSWVQRSSEFLRYSANSLKVKLGFNRPNTRSEVNRSTRLQFISVSEDNFFTNGYLMFVFHLFYELYTFIFQFT
ncbi:uncharacterized protein isoform X18 [Rhodnius prolixus]|uniref:uncharacterized protein isoform X18 n=1 Tax=Rhodnius prolixus TaxID=13249 RepID=UPI003D18A98B